MKKLSKAELESCERYAKGDKKKLKHIKNVFRNQSEMCRMAIDHLEDEMNKKRRQK